MTEFQMPLGDNRIAWIVWADTDTFAQGYIEAMFFKARECFDGKFDSEKDWAENFLEDTGALGAIPENLRCYFDYDAYARDAGIGGDLTFVRHDGDVWAFWNH